MRKSKILRDLGLFWCGGGFGLRPSWRKFFYLGFLKKDSFSMLHCGEIPEFDAASEVRIPFFCMTLKKDPNFMQPSGRISHFGATVWKNIPFWRNRLEKHPILAQPSGKTSHFGKNLQKNWYFEVNYPKIEPI
ncbi:hypothetical protein [Lactobacillus sp.]|uniref:hypothetical protein n=1 Tax=Lactobacillus sp. TaxID=1591 RepID=UPI003EF6CDEE